MTNGEKQKILNYRIKHPRCKYCKYCKYFAKNFFGEKMYLCLIDKNMFFLRLNFLSKIKGCFCDYFEPEAIDEI